MSDTVEDFTPGFDEDTAIKILGWLADITGAKDWDVCDGSETFEGDVKGTIYNILQSAGVYEDWRGTIARHAEITRLTAALSTAREDALREAITWHKNQADYVMNGLHCGSENYERRAARDAYEFHHKSAKDLLALIPQTTKEEKGNG